MAVCAAFFLISAGLSDVATTTTERAIPSGPKSLSINSLTSLPRSPISAITFISAFVFLANIPISVLFPTPLPANIPILCPLPTVIKPSTAFTPRGRTSSIIFLVSGSGGSASTEYAAFVASSVLSIGCPKPSSVLPRSSSPTETLRGAPVFSTLLPSPTPSVWSYGIKSTLSSLKPTTSALIT